MFLLFFFFLSHNNSYADSVRADNGLYYSYTSVFDEYTTQEAGVACNSYANCYIGCSCKTGWNKRSASASSVSDVSNLQTSGVKTASASSLSGNVSTMAAGDSCTVNITDPRYGTSCSISSTKDCAGVCDGSAYFRCTSGSTSSYCSSGKYSVYLGKQQCSSGNATNSTSCYTCYTCSYSCPSGYYTSAGSGYYLTSTYKYQVCNGDSSQTNSTKCYTREANTCTSEGYVDSCPTGQTGTPVTINSGSSTKTCYKDCKNNSFTITISKVFTRSCPTNFASGFNGISSCTIGGKSCATSENSITISNVASGANFKWTPQSSYSNNAATATTSDSFDTTITSNATFTATYTCDDPCSGMPGMKWNAQQGCCIRQDCYPSGGLVCACF